MLLLLCVCAGGEFVYCTCSITLEENEDVLASRKGVRLVPIVLPEGVPLLPSLERMTYVKPDDVFGGAFAAKL